MLEIKNLCSGYGKFDVLHDIDLDVKPNEIIALIGPNGAGKSTVIKSIFSLAQKNKGKIMFNERDITNLKTHELIEVGISFVTQGKINFNNPKAIASL